MTDSFPCEQLMDCKIDGLVRERMLVSEHLLGLAAAWRLQLISISGGRARHRALRSTLADQS